MPSAFESVRAEAWSATAVSTAVSKVLANQPPCTERQKQLTQAALLIWHDRLDDAHGIVQDLSDPSGGYLHAIIHRREPDFSNARYWLQRIGSHPAKAHFRSSLNFLNLPQPDGRVLSRVEKAGALDAGTLLCEAELLRNGGGDVSTLRILQAAELLAILNSIGEPGH